MTDRTTLFLKFALKNKFLDQSQADQILSAIEQRRELGIDKSADEVAIERNLLTDTQVAQLNQAVDAISPPTKVGGFEILEEIGRGTVGTVYRARQVSLDKEVALKLLNPSFRTNPEMVEQFKREAKSAAKINHPHVVTAIDAGESDGRSYLAMEYVAGETLKSKVERDGPLEEAELLELARSVTQGLAHAHSHGLLHRDLKPDNLLLGTSGQIKIADFGLAMPMDDAEVMSAEHKRRGTPYYLSPEQARGESVSEASEIYALGATLFFVATGRPLFSGNSVKEILLQQIQATPPSPRESGALITPETDALILDMVAKDPSARPSSCADVLERIDAIESGAAQTVSPPPVQRKPAVSSKPTISSKPTLGSKSSGKPAVAKSAPGSGGAASRPAAPGARSAPSDALRNASIGQRNNTFTLIGLGCGVVIAVIFIILAATRNEPENPTEVVQQEEERSEEEITKRIETRMKTWQNKIDKRNRLITESVPKVDLLYQETQTRVDALWVMLKEPGKASARSANVIWERIDELEGMTQSSKEEGLRPFMTEVDQLRSDDRLFDAIEKLAGIPRELRKDSKTRETIDRLIEELSTEIDDKHREDSNTLQKAIGKQDYGNAIRLLEKILVYGDVDMQKDASLQLEQVRKDQATFVKKEEERRVQEENRKYLDHVRSCKQLALERRFLDCISTTVKLEQETTSSEVLALIQEDLAAFQMLHKFYKDAEQYLIREKGSKTAIKVKLNNDDIERGTSDGIEMIEGKPAIRLVVDAGSGQAIKFLEFERILDPTIFDWVEALHGSKSEEYLVPLALLFGYRGQIEFARRHVELASRQGHDMARWEKRIDWLEKNLGE